MGSGNISESVIRRLPRYYRFLEDLKASGIMRISSRELSAKMGMFQICAVQSNCNKPHVTLVHMKYN